MRRSDHCRKADSARGSGSARWIASDALRELTSESVGEGSLSVLHELELLREVGVDDVAEAVPREGLLLALLLYLQEGVELFVPHLVGVPRVLLELVEPLDVYLGQLVGGKFVLYDVICFLPEQEPINPDYLAYEGVWEIKRPHLLRAGQEIAYRPKLLHSSPCFDD